LNEVARNLALDGLNAFPDSKSFYVYVEDSKGHGFCRSSSKKQVLPEGWVTPEEFKKLPRDKMLEILQEQAKQLAELREKLRKKLFREK
jgi:hypothetical protein